jgi:hypothetical protein
MINMQPYTLLALFAGVVAASNAVTSLRATFPAILPRDVFAASGHVLSTRQSTCAANQTPCGDGCMDAGATCCN